MLPTRGVLATVSAMARTPARPGSWPLIVLVAWTVYVWSTRIANALGDAALSSGGKAFSVGLSLTFEAFAVAGIVIVVRSWSRPRTHLQARVVQAFAAWTVLVWVVRVPMIALDDHVVGFKVVHAMLGVISIALAVWAVWAQASAVTKAPAESVPAESRG
jgi:hypothetical protein